ADREGGFASTSHTAILCDTCVDGTKIGHPSCLPPWAPASISIVSRASLLARACLIDRQGPSPECRPVEPSNCRTGLGGVWHLDKAKASRAAGLAIGDDPDALDAAIRLEQLAQLFFGGRIRKIRDINVHEFFPSWSYLSASISDHHCDSGHGN